MQGRLITSRAGARASRVVHRSALAGALLVSLGLGANVAAAAAATPMVLGLSPLIGSTSGTTTVTLYGQGFVKGATTVKFGPEAASQVDVESESKLTAVAPAGAAGQVDITATTASGTSATSAADQYTYAPATPSQLQDDAAGLRQVALTWKAPSTPGVTGYTVSRSIEGGAPAALCTVEGKTTALGCTGPTTDGYTTNYVDNSAAPGTTYTYTVTAQTASGSTGASNTFTVTTPKESEARTITHCESQPLGSGTYVMEPGSSLPAVSGGEPCLKLAGSNISLDCQGGTISDGTEASGRQEALRVEGASHFVVVNCLLSGATSPGSNVGYVLGSSFGAFASDQFAAPAPPSGSDPAFWVVTSNDIGITDSSFTNTKVSGRTLTDAYFGRNTFTNPSAHDQSAAIELYLTNSTVADGNHIDGGDTLQGATEPPGADDGINPSASVDDIVVNNTIAHVFDAGVEPSDGLVNSLVAHNRIEYAHQTGFGTYYGMDLVNDTISGNVISHAGEMLYVFNRLSEGLAAEYVLYNTFADNTFEAPNGSVPASSYVDAEEASTPTVAGGNVFRGNNFGTEQSGPTIEPVSMVSEAVNNVCDDEREGETGSPSLSCPTVAHVTPASGSVLGGTAIEVVGSGFKSNTPYNGADTVAVDGVPATEVDVTSDTELTAKVPPAVGGAPGSAAVVVHVPGIPSLSPPASAVAANAFTYTPVIPTVSGVSTAGTIFAEGAVAGGTKVTVTGSGFTQGAKVYFGSTPGTEVDVLSSSELTVTSPVAAESTGYVDVTVNTPSGTSAVSEADQYVYGPTVTAVSPSSGPSTSPTRVTFSGTGFNADGGFLDIFVNGTYQPLTEVTVVSPTKLEATVPASPSGAPATESLGFALTGVAGQANSGFVYLSQQFTWTPVVPAVTGVSTAGTIYAEGGIAGGTTVTVTGSGFTRASKVYFGSTLGSEVHVLSSTELTVKSPAASESTGYVDVTVHTQGGTSAVSEADQFVYGPTVTSCTPASGPKAGGTRVKITGTGFYADGGLSAIFTRSSLTPLTELTTLSSTELEATMPRGVGTTSLGFSLGGVTGQENNGWAFLACSFTYE